MVGQADWTKPTQRLPSCVSSCRVTQSRIGPTPAGPTTPSSLPSTPASSTAFGRVDYLRNSHFGLYCTKRTFPIAILWEVILSHKHRCEIHQFTIGMPSCREDNRPSNLEQKFLPRQPNSPTRSAIKAITASPPPNWSVKRRLEYVAWARDVVSGLRGANEWLEAQFDKAAAAAEESVRP